MSRLRPLPPRTGIRALKRLGWQETRQRGNHLIMTHVDKDFILVMPTHKQISKGVLNQIVKDFGLTVEEFLRLIWSSNNAG
ncbi:MAG: type II toxin-antitoxin system HicA family toxin [Candidatus Heimdallarchaeota archaeon]